MTNTTSLRFLPTVGIGLLLTAFAAQPIASATPSPHSFTFRQEISNEDYAKLVRPLATAARFHFLRSASPTGTYGFDLGVGVTSVAIPAEARSIASATLQGGDDLSDTVLLPRFTLQKGIPFDIDLAVNLALMPDDSGLIAGGAVQWALLDGPFPIPSFALRMGHTQIINNEFLKSQSTTAEGIVSIGFPPGINLIVPYGGGGMAWTATQSKGTWQDPDSNLTGEVDASFSDQEAYGLVGLQLYLFPLAAITAEMQIGQTHTLYSARLALAL
jgi:hypothetical protein